jgi:hypothetical protein
VTQSHTNHQEPSETIKEPSEVDALLVGIDPEVLRDFKRLRTQQKAPITVTAIKGFIREAGIAGYTLEEAIRTSTENSWRGFKAIYVAARKPAAHKATEPAWRTEQRQRTQLAAPGVAAHQDAQDFFDVEAVNVTTRRLG